MVTQHSGEGKANQYQLRGFQLDHGTDFEITLDGMPLNMPTHGHGQGYADANFLIPELFSYIIAKKGPYFADEGDFSSAGAVHIQYKDELPGGLFSATAGSFDYGRLLGINSDKVAGGNLLSAVELGIYNGPWTVPDEMHKINGVLRWSQGTDDNGLSVTAMAYANHWHASNQIPERAVTEGVISLWGNIDPTDRGDTTRFSLSTCWSEADANSHSRVEAFAIHSTLDLFNDFDYYLTQPIIGDQFRQFDRRTVLGLKAEHGWNYEFAGFPMETRIGLQSRYDNIRVGLQDTYQTMPYDTLTNDQVAEGNVGVWTDTTVKWNPWLRTTAGLRGDFFAASIGDYQNPLAAPTAMPFGTLGALPIWTGPWNSGSKAAAFDSPKASVVLGPWEKTEFFLNFGEGFHSTDARGTVTSLNPPDGSQATPIPLLVKSRGAEIGARSKFIDGLDSTMTFWWLNFDSESQFDGDSGTTLFGRPSRRYGIEFTNRYTYNNWVRVDADLSLSHARSRGWDMPQTALYASLLTPDTIGYFTYLGNAPGNYIPEAPPVVASIAVELGEQTGWFGALKFRFKAAYPLTEDGYFKAPAAGWVDVRGGYRWENGLKLQIDAFNLLNSRSDQITYAYGSLLPTDPLYAPCQNSVAPAAVCAIGQMDRHFKPMEPTAIRVTLSGPLLANVFDPNPRPPTQRRVAAQGLPGPDRRCDRRRLQSARRGGKSAQQKGAALRRAAPSRVVWALCRFERRSGLRRRQQHLLFDPPDRGRFRSGGDRARRRRLRREQCRLHRGRAGRVQLPIHQQIPRRFGGGLPGRRWRQRHDDRGQRRAKRQFPGEQPSWRAVRHHEARLYRNGPRTRRLSRHAKHVAVRFRWSCIRSNEFRRERRSPECRSGGSGRRRERRGGFLLQNSGRLCRRRRFRMDVHAELERQGRISLLRSRRHQYLNASNIHKSGGRRLFRRGRDAISLPRRGPNRPRGP